MNRKLLFAHTALVIASLACNTRLSIVALPSPTPVSGTPATQSGIIFTEIPPRQPALNSHDWAQVNPIPPTTTLMPTLVPPSPTSTATSTMQPVENPLYLQGQIENMTYCTVNGLPLYGDVYFPKNAPGATPLLIYIHGGAWYSGDKNDSSALLDASVLLDAGFTVASINYRLAPDYKMPAMIEDVKCAVRSFRAHAATYNIDPDRIGVWGSSAGGHLAAMLGTADVSAGFDVGEYLEYSSRVQAVVDIFGPADLDNRTLKKLLREIDTSVFGTSDLADPIFIIASPVTYVSLNDPPFLILHGDEDKVVPPSQSQELYDTLISSGVDAQLVIVKGAAHGFGYPGEKPSRDELTRMIVTFFTENLMLK